MKKQIMRIAWSGQTGPFERSRRAAAPACGLAYLARYGTGSIEEARTCDAPHSIQRAAGRSASYCMKQPSRKENSLNVNNHSVQ